MLKSLDKLRMGSITNKAFSSEIKLRRVLDLSESQYVSVDPVFTVGHVTLDIERVDERYMICGGNNGSVVIYDLRNTTRNYSYTTKVKVHMRPTGVEHPPGIVKVQWNPCDKKLFSILRHKDLSIWDVDRLEAVERVIFLDSKIFSHALSSLASNNHLIAIATSNSGVLLYDFISGLETHLLRGHQAEVQSVTWSPMSEYLLASGGKDNRILLWDVRQANHFLKCLDKNNGNVSEYKTVGCKSSFPTAHNSAVTCLKFTDDGLHLVSQSAHDVVLLWDVALGKNTLVNYGIQCKRYSRVPSSFDICNDSRQPVLFIPSLNKINVCDLFSGIKHKTLKGHTRHVYCCVYRSSSQELYSAGNDENIMAWLPSVSTEVEDEFCQNKWI